MSDIITKNISVEKTARYFLLGKSFGKVEELWFVLHGYGQLAEDFIKQFEFLNNGSNLIVAPEALNKFYVRGFSGKIGASWMTKEDRENEIADYINYLNKISETIFNDVTPQKINVLGFSQGTATVCRWLNSSKLKPENIFLCSGGVPPDLHLDKENSFLHKSKLWLIVGNADEFISKDRIDEEEELLKKSGTSYKLIVFDGGHTMNLISLKNILKN
ncbi:alpha/beta hydrolase [Melioribacteraceae bacterium 4301-Me]|uniref:alpha/beta hydrolase n=1 Tax=Pyranulibacter aquaticus TaxID=3163344 RepID=UPI00359BB718